MSQGDERRQDPIAAIVAGRVRELRDRRGWSGTELAERMAEAGMPQFDRGILANFESGRRRSISVDEVLVLALVLDVAPVHLFVPVEEVRVERGWWTVSAGPVREWVRGNYPLPSQDSKVYRTEVPDEEWRAFEEGRRAPTAEELRALIEGLGGSIQYTGDGEV